MYVSHYSGSRRSLKESSNRPLIGVAIGVGLLVGTAISVSLPGALVLVASLLGVICLGLILRYPYAWVALYVATLPFAMGPTVLHGHVYAAEFLLAPMFLGVFLIPGTRITWNALDVLVLLFPLLGLASIPYAIDPIAAWGSWLELFLAPVFLYIFVRRLPDKDMVARAFLMGLAVGGVGISLFAFGQQLIVAHGIQWGGTAGYKIHTGTFLAQGNGMDMYLDRVWPVLVLSLTRPLSPKLARRGWILASGLLVVVGILLALSRGSWVADIVALVCLGVWGNSVERSLFKRILLPIAAIFTLTPLAIRATQHFGTAYFRLILWQRSLEMWAMHPWFGVGVEQYVRLYPQFLQTAIALSRTHNIFLDFLVLTGVFGLTWFLLILFLGYRVWRKVSHQINISPIQSLFLIWFALATLVTLVHGLIDSPFFSRSRDPVMWIALAQMASLVQNNSGRTVVNNSKAPGAVL